MRLLWSFAAALAVVACTSSPPEPIEPPCVADLDEACQPTYDPPVFDTIYAKILHPTCASGRGTCHTSDAQKGGLVFEGPDRAYALLMGQDGSRPRVLGGDPSCSVIVKRLTSDDPAYHMPPGSTPLTDGEICTITKWIAAGAKR